MKKKDMFYQSLHQKRKRKKIYTVCYNLNIIQGKIDLRNE